MFGKFVLQDRSGCTIYSADGNVGNGNTICDPDPVIPAGATVRSRNASTITLDAHIAKRKNILLWKMDTEGYEGQVCTSGCSVGYNFVALVWHSSALLSSCLITRNDLPGRARRPRIFEVSECSLSDAGIG